MSLIDKNSKKIATVSTGARFALAWERLWPLCVPLFLVLLTFVGLSWVGLWQALPIWAHILLLGALLAAMVGALIPLRQFKMPDGQEISRRIEIETQLDDRPISAQSDEMALGEDDEFSRALWHEHRVRMNERLDHLRAGTPKADGGRFDPYGARLILPILIFVAFMFSQGANGGRVSDAFRFEVDPAKLLARLDVWVNPPTYTNKAPVYLSQSGSHQEGQSIVLPQNSELIGRFVGAGNITLRFNSGETQTNIAPVATDDEGSDKDATTNYQLKLKSGGILSVYSRQKVIAQWSLKITPDNAPEISFSDAPSAALSGALQLAYKVSDDYGVTKARAIVEALQAGKDGTQKFDPQYPARFVVPLNARPLIGPLEIKLPLPRRRTKSGETKVNREVSKHPLAGSIVRLTLEASDDLGQIGLSETVEMKLPGRRFSNPIARSLVEQRRILALDANQQQNVIAMLDAASIAPELFVKDFTAHMALGITYRRLVDASSDDQLREVMDLMWDVALGIEFGDLSNAERRLRDAQERLSEALENGASDKEISKLMDELRQAMNELMQAMKEQAQNNPQSRNPLLRDEASRTLRQKDLQRMMDRIEQLAKSGSKDAARELLAEMQRMMDNLRAGRHMQQNQAEGNQTNEALDNLSALMQKQQKLMDETFRMEQQRPPSSQPNDDQANEDQENGQQPGERQNQNGDEQGMSAQEYADALKKLNEQQRALQEQLNALNKQLQDLGLAPSKEFDEAGKQMGEAGKQLGQGEAGNATGNQGQALQALRRGAKSMMQQMAGDRQQGGQQQGNSRSDRDGRDMRDPLGRDNNRLGSQSDFNGNTPGEIDAQQARRILEAIRNRLSLPNGQIIEKDYLERLLESR